MKNACMFLLAVIFTISFVSCGSVEETEKPSSTQVDTYSNMSKISVDEAEKLIRTLLINTKEFDGLLVSGNNVKSGIGPGPSKVVSEKTTDEIWEKFRVQIFTFYNHTYFVRDSMFIYAIDTEFQNYVITDLNMNLIPEIIFLGSITHFGFVASEPQYNLRIYTEDSEINDLTRNNYDIKKLHLKTLEKISDYKVKLISKKHSFNLTTQVINNKTKLLIDEIENP